MIVGNAVWELIRQSDMTSCIVILSLLFMSILSWTILFYKMFILRGELLCLKKLLQRLEFVSSFEQLHIVDQEFKNSFPGQLIHGLCIYVTKLISAHPTGKKYLTMHDIDLLKNHIETLLNDYIVVQEQYLSIIKISAEVAPLLGLFGTIWGLIHSFVRISQEQVADIVTVAPGIAEALITTLIGLIVAIPALIFFHYLLKKIEHLDHMLFTLSDRCMYIIQSSLNKRED